MVMLFCTVFHGEETASDDDDSLDGRREIKVQFPFFIFFLYKLLDVTLLSCILYYIFNYCSYCLVPILM